MAVTIWDEDSFAKYRDTGDVSCNVYADAEWWDPGLGLIFWDEDCPELRYRKAAATGCIWLDVRGQATMQEEMYRHYTQVMGLKPLLLDRYFEPGEVVPLEYHPVASWSSGPRLRVQTFQDWPALRNVQRDEHELLWQGTRVTHKAIEREYGAMRQEILGVYPEPYELASAVYPLRFGIEYRYTPAGLPGEGPLSWQGLGDTTPCYHAFNIEGPAAIWKRYGRDDYSGRYYFLVVIKRRGAGVCWAFPVVLAGNAGARFAENAGEWSDAGIFADLRAGFDSVGRGGVGHFVAWSRGGPG